MRRSAPACCRAAPAAGRAPKCTRAASARSRGTCEFQRIRGGGVTKGMIAASSPGPARSCPTSNPEVLKKTTSALPAGALVALHQQCRGACLSTLHHNPNQQGNTGSFYLPARALVALDDQQRGGAHHVGAQRDVERHPQQRADLLGDFVGLIGFEMHGGLGFTATIWMRALLNASCKRMFNFVHELKAHRCRDCLSHVAGHIAWELDGC